MRQTFFPSFESYLNENIKDVDFLYTKGNEGKKIIGQTSVFLGKMLKNKGISDGRNPKYDERLLNSDLMSLLIKRSYKHGHKYHHTTVTSYLYDKKSPTGTKLAILIDKTELDLRILMHRIWENDWYYCIDIEPMLDQYHRYVKGRNVKRDANFLDKQALDKIRYEIFDTLEFFSFWLGQFKHLLNKQDVVPDGLIR